MEVTHRRVAVFSVVVLFYVVVMFLLQCPFYPVGKGLSVSSYKLVPQVHNHYVRNQIRIKVRARVSIACH